MGCYKILSTPISDVKGSNYKGLYRSEPYPQSESDKEYIYLWDRYVQYLGPLTHMGITSELSLDELNYLAKISTERSGVYHEVIYFDSIPKCPHPSEYLGIDVTGIGGYSIVGEDFFQADGTKNLWYVLSQYFRQKVNKNGLFATIEDANSFLTVLNDLEQLSPGCIEEEEKAVLSRLRL